MKIYSLKSIARRSTSFGAALALIVSSVGSAVLPMVSVYADALNPLTDRSLTLSSGSPGWSFTDGSGNATYAPPNSGANGQKTGNTFAFKVSSTATVKAFTFQYCTFSAGDCMGPGNNACQTGTTGGNDCVRRTNAQALSASANTSDLEVVTSSPSQATFATYVTNTNAATNPNGLVSTVPAPSTSGNNFLVYYNNAGTWTASTGWTMTKSVNQTVGGSAGNQNNGTSTAKDNYITLTNATGQALTGAQDVRIVFFGTNTNYITNPGSNAFFVKINTYNSDSTQDDTTRIDGGVTVANVMNQSIQITTRVMETMDFSVGIVDPYTLDSTGGASSELHAANGNNAHGTCDAVLPGMTSGTITPNVLQMGETNYEFSLSTSRTYSTHSYWRLSSNSSAGATVYYSGETLSNTVGDQIDAIGPTAAAPLVGTEQFGLALANGSSGIFAVDYGVERGAVSGLTGNFENGADNSTSGVHASVATDVGSNPAYHSPRLSPLSPITNYGDGDGVVNTNYNGAGAISTAFAFDTTSRTIPVPIASENTQFVDCVTGKMRYIANIAATTPAGLYTTKINYIASPQY